MSAEHIRFTGIEGFKTFRFGAVLPGFLLAAVLLSWSGMRSQGACNYNKTIAPGYTLVANQCDNTSKVGDLIKDATTSSPVPDGSFVAKWNNAMQSWEPCNLYSAATKTWGNPDQLISPGDGAFLFNPSGSAYTLTISGGDNVDTPSAYCPPGTGIFMVSRKVPLACANFHDITQCTPIPFNRVFKWTGTAYSVFVFDPDAGGWTPSDPTAAVGEAVWYCRSSVGGCAVGEPPCCSYTKSIAPGYTLIANQCGNSSKVSDLIKDATASSPVPDGSQVVKWNNALQNWDQCNLYSAATKTWSNPDQLISPGEGAFLLNPSASAYTLTISGAANADTPSAYCAPVTGIFIVSRKVPRACANFHDITQCTPVVFDKVYKWTGAAYNSFVLDPDVGWMPSDPTASVGEAVWYFRGGGGGPGSQPPCCITIAKTITLTWACNCRLEHAATLDGPWAAVLVNGLPATSPYTTAATESTGFYRTVCP